MQHDLRAAAFPYAAVTGLALAAAAAAAAAAVTMGTAALAVPVGLAAAGLLLRYPGVLLTLFLYVGLFKREAIVQALPFDATVALAALLVVVMAYRAYSGSVRRMPAVYAALLVMLVALMALSLLWTESIVYGSDKVLRFATLTVVAALSPFFLIRDTRELASFLWAGAGLACFAAALTLLNPPPSATGRLQLGDSGTIFVGRLLCTGALILLILPAARRDRPGLRLGLGAVAVGLVFVAAGIGSRGPVIAAALALVCTTLAWGLRDRRQLAPVAAVVVLGVMLFSAVELPDVAEQRLATAAADPVGTLKEDGRSALYRQAIELTREHPTTGIGAGGFRVYTGVIARQTQRYPHNLFLELSSEIGVLAPVLLLGVIAAALAGLLHAAWRARRREMAVLLYLLTGLLLFHLFAVQFSGDVNDNKAFWTALGLSCLALGLARDESRAESCARRRPAQVA